MPKASSKYVCQQCGFESVKWMGRCPDCGAWSSLVETVVQPARPEGKRGGGIARAGAAVPIPLSQVQTIKDARRPTGSGELDRVLGGGFVPGSLVLFAGDPGIGKVNVASFGCGACRAARGRGALRLGGGIGPAGEAARRAAGHRDG